MGKCLFIAFVCLFSVFGHAKTAYFGVVGIGKGNGVLGHSFLLVKDARQPYLVGDVYQYNISGKSGQAISPADVLGNTSNLIFSLKHQKFLQIFGHYTAGENRIIALYELDLSDKEVNELMALLNHDLVDLKFPDKHQYGIYNNCVTRPIELLNSIVDGSRKIDYLGQENVFSREGIGILASIRGALLNRLPFILANTLEHHPISKGRVQLYESKTTQTARFFSSIRTDLTKMKDQCGWNLTTKNTLELYLMLFLTEPERYGIEPVLKLVQSCDSAIHIFTSTILKLYQVMDDKNEIGKQKLYELTSQMRRQ